MPKLVIYLCIVIPAILVGIGLTLYFFQEKLIFYPNKLNELHKFKFSIPFEEKVFTMEDGIKLNALYFKSKSSKGLIFYLHGNAGSLDNWGLKAYDFTKNGYDVLMYDYRGFGKSEGKIINEKQMYSDAAHIYKELYYNYKEKDIIIYGISLGSGLAVKLTHANHPKMLILETPYYNFYDVAKYLYPYLPTSWLLHYKFKNDLLIPEIKVPIHIFHGTNDETVPYNSSERLLKLNKNIQLTTIKEGSHNNLNTFNLYQDTLKTILSN